MEYRIKYVGHLTAQQRPLGVARRYGGKTIVKQIDRPESRGFKAIVSLLAQRELENGGETITNPCSIRITATKKIPESWNKSKKLKAQMGWIQPTIKPDVDNLAKGIMDAFSGILYHDDKQIVELSIKKVYGDSEGFYAVVSDEMEF